MTREYSPEIKATVMAALLAGQSASSAAKEYKIPKGTISGWRKQAESMVEVAGVATGTTQKKQEQIGDLLIDLLIAKLKSQIAMAEHSGDKNWLAKQDADAFAMLMGVADDKLDRLLGRFAGGKSDPGISSS